MTILGEKKTQSHISYNDFSMRILLNSFPRSCAYEFSVHSWIEMNVVTLPSNTIITFHTMNSLTSFNSIYSPPCQYTKEFSALSRNVRTTSMPLCNEIYYISPSSHYIYWGYRVLTGPHNLLWYFYPTPFTKELSIKQKIQKW